MATLMAVPSSVSHPENPGPAHDFYNHEKGKYYIRFS